MGGDLQKKKKKKKKKPATNTSFPALSPSRSMKDRVGRAIAQKRQMERLSLLPEEESQRSCKRIYVCSDGTRLPYEILGEPSLDIKSFSFVVVHDIFDTMDNTRIFFKKLARRHRGCQVLVYNYSGQAGSTIAPALDAQIHARHLEELTRQVDRDGDMLLSTSPFILVGIGFGFQVCSHFVGMTKLQHPRKLKLQGLVSLNGFVRVDAQLAAAMRSALLAFQTFPKDRPDLPISYLARFLFSDDYLARVNPRLALNIYTAVTNPITLAGRIALLKGLLKDKASTPKKTALGLPLVALQSTQDALVSPAQVDSLLYDANKVRHFWSHELEHKNQDASLGARGRALIRETVWTNALTSERNNKNVACVVWVNAGHEVRQETGRVIDDLFESIVPWADFDDEDRYLPSPATPLSPEQHQSDTSELSKSTDQPRQTCVEEETVVSAAEPCPAPLPAADAVAESIEIAEKSKTNSIPSIVGVVYMTLSMPRMLSEDFTNAVRAALVSDAASIVSRISGVPVTTNLSLASAGSRIVNLKISGLSIEESTVVGAALHAKLHQPILPTYWADHELASVAARKELCRRESGKVDARDSASATRRQQTPPPAQEERLISTAEQRQVRRYAETVPSARDSVQKHHELDTEACGKDGLNETESDERISELKYCEMQRQADIDETDIELVKAGLAPEYSPVAGDSVPVIRPVPVEYLEAAVPTSILRRNDIQLALSSPPMNVAGDKDISDSSPNPPVTNNDDDSQAIKREMSCAQLVREADILALVVTSNNH